MNIQQVILGSGLEDCIASAAKRSLKRKGEWMTEIIRFCDKHGQTIFLLTSSQCLWIGLLIVVGGIAIISFGIALIRIGWLA